jgi:hypothetical protein
VTVEIDVSDIPYGSFYTDARSKRVERIIQNKEEYSTFIVKRYRREQDPSLDIYIAMDETENYWVWMYEWEIDALDDDEIFSYVTVTKETSQRPDPTQHFLIASSFSIALFLSLLICIIIVPEVSTNSIILGVMLVSLITSFITGGIFRGKNREHMQNEREFEAAMITRHPLYHESLRKFSALSNISESQRENYLERIQETDAKMSNQ